VKGRERDRGEEERQKEGERKWEWMGWDRMGVNSTKS